MALLHEPSPPERRRIHRHVHQLALMNSRRPSVHTFAGFDASSVRLRPMQVPLSTKQCRQRAGDCGQSGAPAVERQNTASGLAPFRDQPSRSSHMLPVHRSKLRFIFFLARRRAFADAGFPHLIWYDVWVVRISIELTEEEAARLRAPTTLLPMRPEALAVATVRDQLNAGDAEFDEFATEIVQKNRELYYGHSQRFSLSFVPRDDGSTDRAPPIGARASGHEREG